MDYDLSSAVQYHYNLFPPKEIDYSLFINELVRATDALARFDQMLKNLHYTEILLAPLRNQEAVLSSRMEGTISTMDEILQYEAESDEKENASTRSDVIETILYQRAMKNAQEALSEGYPFSVNFVKQIHQQLLSYGRGSSKTPGMFKNEQNYLADKSKKKIQFIPIRPENLEEGLEKLFDFLYTSTLPPIVKTAIMHPEFEALHPFNDGNGRIGRMLITLNLWRERILSQPHFYISGYFEENKDAYIEEMRDVSRTNDWNSWIRFFLNAVTSQAENNLLIAEKIKDLYKTIKNEFTDVLASKWNMEILDFIFTYPVFRANKLANSTQIPNATAGLIIKKLIEHNYLMVREEAAGRRAALYSFEPLMRIVRV